MRTKHWDTFIFLFNNNYVCNNMIKSIIIMEGYVTFLRWEEKAWSDLDVDSRDVPYQV